MNKSYRLVWNVGTNALVAVPECARGRGKGGVRSAALVTALIVGASAFAAPGTNELPTSGLVVGGTASISQSAATMTIQQSSQRAAIDWNTFNVGSQAQVHFVQPNSAAVTLNRVLDSRPSEIFGRVTATGQVFLVNPNGVYFSPTASVDVGGLVATTHDLSASDFMAGKNTFNRNGSTGKVVNEGRLNAVGSDGLGGYIALLAPEVRNDGVIIAQLGTTALASGESITLNIEGSRTLASLTVTPSQIKSLVENRQLVQAPGGLIILSAQAANALQGGVVNNSGRLEATGLAMRGGRIVLEASSRVENSGTINANAGNGGLASDGSPLPGGPAGSISLKAPEVINTGLITATVPVGSAMQAAGAVEIQAANIAQIAGARIDVSNRVGGQAGSVVLQASQDVTVAGEIQAQALDETGIAEPGSALGGDITIQAGRNVTLQGAVLDASGLDRGGRVHVEGGGRVPDLPQDRQPTVALTGPSQVRTSSRRGKGGEVSLLAENVLLFDNAWIDATGATGGGLIQVGGSWQGGDPNVHQATVTYISPDSILDASATQTGPGGTVVAWSDIHNPLSVTRVYGALLAKGGEISGDGGRIETSGYWVDVTGIKANASAVNGKSGEWLLDPYNLTISAAATTATTTPGSPYLFTSGVGGTNVLNTDIEAQLNLGTSVTLQTSGTDGDGFGNGDILINANISKTAGADATLTLKAHRDIVDSTGFTISSTSNKLNIVFNSDSDGINGGMIYMVSSTITTNGGAITLGGGTDIATGFAQGRSLTGTDIYGNGIKFWTVTLNSGGGDITLRGKGALSGGGAWWSHGLDLGVATIDAGSGKVNLLGVAQADAATLRDKGIQFQGGSILSSNTSPDAIVITGDASASLGTGISQIGIDATNPPVVRATGGGIIITGIKGPTLGSGIVAGGGAGWIIGNAADTGPITIIADTFGVGSGITPRSTGALSIQPYTPGTSVGIAGATGTLQIPTGIFTAGFSNINIGSPVAGAISFNAFTSTLSPLTLTTGGAINVNGTLNAAGQTLSLVGATTVAGAGSVTATGLLLAGPATFTLNNAANSVGTLAADAVGGLSYTNATAMAIGTVGAVNGITALGPVAVNTLAGDQTVTQSVSAGGDIVLNAGKNTAAGVATGGNIVISGGSVSTPGLAIIYTGSIAGSTGLDTLVGIGNSRYNSDETVTNYTLALSSTRSAIYREQPVATMTATPVVKSYDGLAYVGGMATYTGLVNGDLDAGTPAFVGTSQGAINVGSYLITPSLLNNRGYSVTFVDGVLTISAAAATTTTVVPPPIVPPPTSPLPTPGTNKAPLTIYPPTGTGTTGTGTTPTTTVTTSISGGTPKQTPGSTNSPTTTLATGTAGGTVPSTGTTPTTTVSGTTTSGTGVTQTFTTTNGGTTDTDLTTRTFVSPTTITTLTTIMAGSDNPMTGIDVLAGSLIQAAISKGMSSEQAERTGNAYRTALTQMLSQGVPVGAAITRAEQAFHAVSQFLTANTPQAVVKSVVADGTNVASHLKTLANAKTSSGAAAFDKALASALTKGKSFAEAVESAQNAVRQADALALKDNSPQGLLAQGNAGVGFLANRSEAFQNALSSLLAQGYSIEQAVQRAEQLAQREADAALADARNPASALATGQLGGGAVTSTSGRSDKAMEVALARGLPLGEALKRAGLVEAFEHRATESDVRNPTAVFSNGHTAPDKVNPAFDRVLATAIARGETPGQALATAQRAVQKHLNVAVTPASALATGNKVDAVLGAGASRTYRLALGRALARGVAVDKAIALAKRAEELNAFRYNVPANLLRKATAGDEIKVKLADGKPLPSWIRFAPKTGEFVAAEVPDGGLPIQVEMNVGGKSVKFDISETAMR